MISILSTNSRIFDLKMDFLTFAWAKPCGKLCDRIFRIPYQISHLLIPISWAPLGAEKSYDQKTLQKMDFRNWPMKDLRNWPWNPDFGIEIHQYQYRRHTASSKQSSFQFSFRFGKSQYRRIHMVSSLWNNFVGCNAGFRPGSYWYKNLEINFKQNNKISIYVKPLA